MLKFPVVWIQVVCVEEEDDSQNLIRAVKRVEVVSQLPLGIEVLLIVFNFISRMIFSFELLIDIN